MNQNLRVEFNPIGEAKDYQIVRFIGEFDKAGHAEIKSQLDKFIENFQLKNLVFDFSALNFINSEGIGYLMEIHAHLMKSDRHLVIVGLNSHVRDIFTAIGIAEIVKIYQSLDDFINSSK